MKYWFGVKILLFRPELDFERSEIDQIRSGFHREKLSENVVFHPIGPNRSKTTFFGVKLWAQDKEPWSVRLYFAKKAKKTGFFDNFGYKLRFKTMSIWLKICKLNRKTTYFWIKTLNLNTTSFRIKNTQS